VADHADDSAAVTERIEGVHHVVEGVRVEGSEALVDEERVEVSTAGFLGDHVSESEREGQRHHKCFAAGEGCRIAGLARPVVTNDHTEPAARLTRAALAAVPRRNDPAQARARSSAWRTLRWSRVALALDELERAGELLELFEEELAQELPDPHPLRGEARCLRSEWARRRGDAALAMEGAAACRDSLARYYAPGDPRLQHLEATRAAFAAAP